MESLYRIVAEQKFLEGLTEEQLKVVAGCASNVIFPAGEFIFRESEKAEHFYILREGHVALECASAKREPFYLETLKGGDVLGWSWLLPPYQWHFDARTSEKTRALKFDGACLRRKMEADPALGYAMFKIFMPVVLTRLQSARLRMMDVFA